MDCYLSITINCHGQTLHSVGSEQFRYKTFYLLRGARLHNYYSYCYICYILTDTVSEWN